MLLHTILAALVASLAAAAPVADAADAVDAAEAISPRNASAPWGDDSVGQLGERDNRPGLSLWCFEQLGCQGNPIQFFPSEFYDIPFDTPYAITGYSYPYNRDFSCRFDTWNGWMGQFYILGLYDGVWSVISSSNYSGGSGQACVDKWTFSKAAPGYHSLKLMTKRWRPQ
ncbi:uncharacterized protein LOC62_02G002301 [Vanrija pseudolonga]|uniref:Uncharacterized protein n=1 Tax=Vanrija pseudolonga TaxID=143232 RepID=A0AAF1BGH0_9TREE|nr:hypothetical protein LOC62_02G002301 [Vanrija pseudolonga]